MAMMTGPDPMVDQCRIVRQGVTHSAIPFSTSVPRSRSGGAGRPGIGIGSPASAAGANPPDVHQQLLDLAARQEERRRARFAAVASKADLEALQASLRKTFLGLLDGFPEKTGVPPVQKTGTIEADDYVVEKLAYESFPGYFVSALLYRPRTIAGPLPGVLSPCGHSTNGKAAGAYQILHINLAKRGYVVLTYDPVGQGERSQFWDAKRGRSRFNLSCGEHAVLGNPLYLLGTNLARYRIWDGMRGLDYLTSRPEVDPARIGCVGNSGGGTLTAYIAALDPRVTVAAIGCYITTLRRRMGNRIQEDPSADPEQDIFGFVGEGIDHAGLLALRVPRPTLLGTAQVRLLPPRGGEGVVRGGEATLRGRRRRRPDRPGRGGRAARTHPPAPHGRLRVVRPLARRPEGCGTRSRRSPSSRGPTRNCSSAPTARSTSRSDRGPSCRWPGRNSSESRSGSESRCETCSASIRTRRIPLVTEIAGATKAGQTVVVLINGNESRDWREEAELLKAFEGRGHAVVVVDPRGVGLSRPGSSRRPAITPTRSAAWRRTSPTTRSSSASRCWGCAWRTC